MGRKNTYKLIEVGKGNKAALNRERENLFFVGGAFSPFAAMAIANPSGFREQLSLMKRRASHTASSHDTGDVGRDFLTGTLYGGRSQQYLQANPNVSNLFPLPQGSNVPQQPVVTPTATTAGKSGVVGTPHNPNDLPMDEAVNKILAGINKSTSDSKSPGIAKPNDSKPISVKLVSQNDKDIAALGMTDFAKQGFNVAQMDRYASKYFGADYGEEGKTLKDYAGTEDFQKKASNPFSKMNIGKTAAGLGVMVGSIPTGERRGMFDTLDPIHHLAGGRESGVGNAMGDAGVGVFQAGASSGNPYLMAAGAGLKILGGLTNAAFGMKENKQMKEAADASIASNRNFRSNATSFDDIKGPESMTNTNIYEGGWFSGGAAAEKNAAYARDMADAYSWADRSIENNVKNISADQTEDFLRSYSAFGGPIMRKKKYNFGGMIDTGMPAVDFEKSTRFFNTWQNKINTEKAPLAVNNNMISSKPVKGFAEGGLIVPSDNTRVATQIVLPIERQHNFSDLDYFWDSGAQYPAGFWKHKDGRFYTKNPANGEDVTFTQEEVDSIVRANTNKGRKERLKKIVADKKSYKGLLPESDGTLFAIGGDLQSHSADWSTGLTHINAGGSHEESPNDGVQIGTDSEGVPNLVEEGECIYGDYVYSNRIQLDATAKEALHFPKKSELTYAEAAKKLEKEIAERPNDAISIAGFKAQMEQLEEQQERQKQEMEAERAKEAFEALSPEEQTALMQQKAQQDAMEEQAAQEQAMAETQAAQGQPSPEEMAAMEQQAAMAQQQMSPEEAAMIEQQMAAQQGGMPVEGIPEAAPVEQPIMAAEGGEINRFDDGGKLKQAILKIAGAHTLPEFRAWAKKNKAQVEGFDWDAWDPDVVPFEDLIQIKEFREALGKSNPTLAHALSKNYDFGIASPEGQAATIMDIDNGNWDNQKDKWLSAWGKSKDQMWEDLKSKLGDNWEDQLKEILKTEGRAGVEALLKETPSYKNTTEWLKKNPENMRQYLKTVLKESTSDPAKAHARQFINDDGTWKDANNVPTYAQVFGENGKGVREAFPGTYWHSVKEASPVSETVNWVQDEKGEWVPIETDVPEDWKLSNNYSWYDKEGNTNRVYNYYNRPEVAAAGEDTETEGNGTRAIGEDGEKAVEGEIQLKPRYKKETNFGLFGPAVGLGLQLMGVGKPDTSTIDAAIAFANSAPHLAEYKPLGNYLTYNPLDIWYEQNALNAQSRATDRGIMNAGVNQGSTMAGLIANGYNSQLASGDLYRKGLEYNNTLKQQVEAFNRGTDQYNADAFTRNSQFNASALNQNKNFGAQLAMQGAAQKMDADAGWYNSLYGNIGGIFNNLKQWEKYKRDHNTLADMWANGLAGTVTDKTPVASKYVTAVKSSDGGKVKRKKGKKRGMFI